MAIEAGDLVQCVDGAESEGEDAKHDPEWVYVGDILRASGVYMDLNEELDPLTVWFDAKPLHSYPASCFRKIDPASDEFTARIRKCRPIKQGELV